MKPAITAAVLGTMLALPMAALSQSSDSAYCKALSDKYREFSKASADAEAAAAMSQCATNAAAAIPVLEKHLKAGKVPLPPRS